MASGRKQGTSSFSFMATPIEHLVASWLELDKVIIEFIYLWNITHSY